jgi:hypothetical protein
MQYLLKHSILHAATKINTSLCVAHACTFLKCSALKMNSKMPKNFPFFIVYVMSDIQYTHQTIQTMNLSEREEYH